MEWPLSSSKVSVIKVLLKCMIVSSQMYGIQTSFPCTSKVDWPGGIKIFASAYLSLLYVTQTFTQAVEQMELWFPIPLCTLVALTGIYKDV